MNRLGLLNQRRKEAIEMLERKGRAEPNARLLLGLRGLFVFFVFFYHAMAYPFGQDDVSFEARFQHGGDGHVLVFSLYGMTAIFFTLSGYHLWRRFVRAALDRQRVALRAYAARRAARMLPLYYLILGATLLLFSGGSRADGIRWPLDGMVWPHFLLLQNDFAQSFQTLNLVTWTLSVDLFFYIAVPILGLAIFAARRPWGQWLLLALLLIVSIAWRLYACHPGHGVHQVLLFPYWLPFFVGGMTAATIVENYRFRHNQELQVGRLATALLFYGGVIFVLFDLFNHPDDIFWPWRYLGTAIGGAMAVLAVSIGDARAVLWAHIKPLVFFGILGYGIFLWQLPVLLTMRQWDWVPGGFVATMAIGFGTTLVLAVITFLLVELPIVTWVMRRTGGGGIDS